MESPKKKPIKQIYIIVTLSVLIVAGSNVALYALLVHAPTGPGPVQIEITSDKTFYLQGETVRFSIYVNNTQSWDVPKPSTITFAVGNCSRETVCIDYSSPQFFSAHSKEYFASHSWNQKAETDGNTTLVEPGTYTLTVALSGQVDYGDPANFTFQIKPNN